MAFSCGTLAYPCCTFTRAPKKTGIWHSAVETDSKAHGKLINNHPCLATMAMAWQTHHIVFRIQLSHGFLADGLLINHLGPRTAVHCKHPETHLTQMYHSASHKRKHRLMWVQPASSFWDARLRSCVNRKVSNKVGPPNPHAQCIPYFCASK